MYTPNRQQNTKGRGVTPTPFAASFCGRKITSAVFRRRGTDAVRSNYSPAKLTQRGERCRGFTIVELLVSLGLFAIVITISMGALLTLVDASAKARTLQSVMTNMSFTLDSMTRDIRTGREYHCGSTPDWGGSTQNCTSGNTVFSYTDGRTGERVAYRFAGSPLRLERNVGNDGWVQMTSSDLELTNGEFVVGGAGSGDSFQPELWIVIEGTSVQADIDTSFTLRTSVTQRRIDL